MGAELDELSEQYKQLRAKPNVTQLELARAEHTLWHRVILEYGGRTRVEIGERRNWFVLQFGYTVSEYEIRASIYNSGVWAHKFFEYMDRGTLKITTCALLLRRAKQLIKQKALSTDQAFEQTMAEHSGQITAEEPESEVPISVASSRGFHRQITLLTEAYVRDLFKGWHIDDYHLQKLIADFRDSIDVSITELRVRLQHVKRDVRDEGIREIGKTRFEWACQVLGLTQYKYKDPINMTLVKRRKNKRALELHPDRNQSNPKAAEELNSVFEAFAILSQYNDKNNRRVADGNKANQT